MSQRSSYSELNQYLLGTWYAAYRLIISTGLLLIFVLTYPEHRCSVEWGPFLIILDYFVILRIS